MIIMSKKINVIFLINELFINNFEYVYRKMIRSRNFNVTVITCESNATDYKDFVSSRQIYDFLKSKRINCIDSYNPKTKKHIDLRIYNPDYIIFLTPYDIYRPNEYSSENLSKIAKVCDIEYGTTIIMSDAYNLILDNGFYKNCYFHFITNNFENYISEDFKNYDISRKFIPTGCFKVEKYLENKYSKKNWNKIFENRDSLRIVWKPRWTLENVDELFIWLNSLVEYCEKNDAQMLLLEHPMLRSNLKSKDCLDKYINIIKKFDSEKIATYNDYDFLDYVLESDVLISEPSSIIPEYTITGNPIILNFEYEKLNDVGKKVISPDWVTNNINKVMDLLNTCEHKSKIKYKNIIFYEDKKYKTPSSYLLELLRKDYKNVPKEKYYMEYIEKQDKILFGIRNILEKGYYDEKEVVNDTKTSSDIFKMLKNWNDEIVRLKSQ